MNLKDFKKELFAKRPEVAAEFERFDLWFDLSIIWQKVKTYYYSKF